MKFKVLSVILLTLLFCLNSFAQERKFEIEVSMEDTSISINAKEILVKVKIINKAEEPLQTEGLGSVQFQFAKCLNYGNCYKKDDIYVASSGIPKKTLNENESIEFVVNLLDLYWMDGISSYIDTKFPKNFKTDVPSSNIYFQTVVYIPNGFKMDENTKRKIPLNKSFRSNTINVVMNY